MDTTAGSSGATDSLVAAVFATAGCGVGCFLSIFDAGPASVSSTSVPTTIVSTIGIEAAFVIADILCVDPFESGFALASTGVAGVGVIGSFAAVGAGAAFTAIVALFATAFCIAGCPGAIGFTGACVATGATAIVSTVVGAVSGFAAEIA